MNSSSVTAEADVDNTAGARILVADDENLFARAICKRLGKNGFICEPVASLGAARAWLSHNRADLILLDMRFPDGSGLDFLRELRDGDHADTAVVVLTAYGEVEDAVAAMKYGALDYLKKPIDLDELTHTVEKALTRAELGKRLDHSRQRENHAIQHIELLGDSAPMQRVREQLARIGTLTAKATGGAPPTVLILGETGSGKDLLARCLHLASARRDRPFVHVDCASLPKDLIEAELFGHEKGAFTSAHSARTGLIEAAEDGTVFLDEIAELSLELQVKLLAVLERRTLRRLGSSRERPVAAWFLAATNRDLEQMVKQGEFRSDLYFRLKVLTLRLPPLRERGDDVLVLARHFAARTARRYGLPQPEFDDDALQALRRYDWPGNIRELMNLIERAVLLSGGERLSAAALLLEEEAEAEPLTALVEPTEGMTLEAAEAALIRQALARAGGNVSEAARQLGVTRMTLRYRMQKYAIAAR